LQTNDLIYVLGLINSGVFGSTECCHGFVLTLTLELGRHINIEASCTGRLNNDLPC
jgi:hypothetical protein